MEKAKFFNTMRPSKSTKDFQPAVKEYPTRKEDYTLIETVGRGVTATVWHAKCIPLGDTVAVKILDLERMNVQMTEVIQEAQHMCLYNHPNVLSLFTAFVVGKDLWLVEPFVDGGSVYNIIKYKYPNGLDEMVIAVIMKEVAKALEYVHRSGGIHRDVKAGNILLNTDGSVLLADFGVAATMERGGSWGNDKISRNTFVGTPCWMAPEVMEQTSGYDSKADIWSFGITMLELAHGHAPFAKFPPIKVLLMTIQNPPPQLEAECGQRQFSKAMRDLVSECLQKDPTKRPTASRVLESKFFKAIPDTKYLATNLVGNLPSLASRVKMLEEGQGEATNDDDATNEAIKAKEEYVRGVSGWNFGDIVGEAKAPLSKSPKIDETKEAAKATEDALLEGQDSAAAQKPPEMPPKAEQLLSPRQDAGVLSPTKRQSEHVSAAESGSKATHEKNGKGSRFSVTTKGTPPKKSASGSAPDVTAIQETSHALVHAKGEDGAFSSQGDLPEHEREHHKVSIVGRFRVQDQVVKKEDSTKDRDRERTKAASTTMTTATGSSFIPPATVLSSQLQSFLTTQKQMFTSMERMVDALKEAEKGQPAALQTLVSSSLPESHDALIHKVMTPLSLPHQRRGGLKVKELENENKWLKDRVLHLEQQLSHLAESNGPASSSQEKH